MRRWIRDMVPYHLGLLGLLLIIAGCGGGGGGTAGPSADAPIQLDLQIRALTSERTGGTVRYLITFVVKDRNNDLIGGKAELKVVATGQVFDFTLSARDFSGDCASQCTGRGVFTLSNPPPGRIDLVHTVIDAAGHRSNGIAFFVTIAAGERPRAGASGQPGIDYTPAK